MPPITRTLIFANLAVFVLQRLLGPLLVAKFALWPLGAYYDPELQVEVGFRVWQLFTYAFLHAGLLHIGFNMFALYMFGRDVEWTLGTRYFLALYFGSVLAAAGAQLAVVTFTAGGGVYPTIGASGGVFGILLAFGMLFPRRIIVLLIPPIPMPAKYFVLIYGLLELFNGVAGTWEGVAHFAHLGGMLGAFLVLRFRRWRAGATSRRPFDPTGWR